MAFEMQKLFFYQNIKLVLSLQSWWARTLNAEEDVWGCWSDQLLLGCMMLVASLPMLGHSLAWKWGLSGALQEHLLPQAAREQPAALLHSGAGGPTCRKKGGSLAQGTSPAVRTALHCSLSP